MSRFQCAMPVHSPRIGINLDPFALSRIPQIVRRARGGIEAQFCIRCQEAVDRSLEEIQAPGGDLPGRAA